MGGGMRQVGVIAAAGLIALEKMPSRLHEDHDNARRLAEALAELRHFEVDLSAVQTNIVVANLNGVSSSGLVEILRGENVLAVPIRPQQVRFVTHRNITLQDIDRAISVLQRLDGQGLA